MVLALAFSAAELSKQRALVVARGHPDHLDPWSARVAGGALHLLRLDPGAVPHHRGYVEFSPFACGVLALSPAVCELRHPDPACRPQCGAHGQRLAAQALGLGKGHTFFRIVLPQAWRHALPGLGNQWLVLLKDTALVSLIGVNEMMRQAQMASASTYQPFTWYAAAALIYLAISLVSEFGLKQASRYTRRYGG